MDFPEHEKLRAVRDESQAQGEFIDWLGQQGIMLYHEREFEEESILTGKLDKWTEWVPCSTPITKLLAEYHGIDLDKLEQEKRAMLDAQRAANAR